jgi:hypothetical protein
MISRSQMNRQLYQMGGEGMQAGMQGNMQEGIMQMAPQGMQSMQQMAPQEMQQMNAEQYRPIAEQLAQDPNQALMAIVRMLMEQGIPEEEAIKIARQMIQAVAEGGMEELSNDSRVEARFGGRIGYAEGGISNVDRAREMLQRRAPDGEFLAYINPEEAGILKALGGAGQDINATGVPSFFIKKIFKGVSKAVKGVTSAVKSVAKSPIGRMALTVAAMYALGPAGLGIGAGMSPFAAGALKAGIANLAVQAVSGQGINFKEGLLAAGLGGVTGSLTAGQTGGIEGATDVSQGLQGVGLGNPTLTGVPQGAPIFGMDNIPVGSAASSAIPIPESLTKITGDFGGNILTPQSTQNSFLGDYSVSSTPPVYEQTSFGKTIGEVETPLSQRYDTFKSALGEGNYLDALKQVSGVALDYPLTTLGGISTLVGVMAPQIPEQLPGESMEEYRARVAEFERQYASNLAGRTGPSLPSSARNPFYPVYAANGGRIGYQEGSGPLRPMSPTLNTDSQGRLVNSIMGQPITTILPLNRESMDELQKIYTQNINPNILNEQNKFILPESARNPFYSPFLNNNLEEENEEIENTIKQVTQQSFFNQPNIPMMANGGRMNYSKGSDDKTIPISGDEFQKLIEEFIKNQDKQEKIRRENKYNGGRMGYAMGNSVQEGIMAAPQIANQMGMPVGNPRMNEGGVPELDYRDQGGFVPPIGIKERADDIPAMLSNNEFVFTANAVKNAGGGDPNIGAQKMYSLMKRLESGGRV